MRANMFVICVLAVAACSHYRPFSPVRVNSAKPPSSELVMAVTNALESSQTFLSLRLRAKQPMVFIREQADGWVTVDIGNLSKDFFHRWATLKVETNTGAIMRLGADDKFEDKWTVELTPQNVWRELTGLCYRPGNPFLQAGPDLPAGSH